MSKSKFKEVKKGKLKMFFLFLFIATFLWFLSKFSKEFTATVDASLWYVNVPENVLLSENNINQISFDLTANGFDFLFYKINKPVISINLQNFYKKGETELIITKQDLLRVINLQLKKNIAIKNVSVEGLQIKLDELETKKIKVNLIEEIEFEKGYKSVNGFKIIPDSIVITGASHILDSLNLISTEVIKLSNVKESISIILQLIQSENDEISYSQKQIQLTASVKEFTQKSLTIPIIIKNLPEEIDLKIIPELMTLTFDVSMEEYNDLTENDFSIICDYNKRNETESFMVPQFIKRPDSILNLELSENKIKYLIFK